LPSPVEHPRRTGALRPAGRRKPGRPGGGRDLADYHDCEGTTKAPNTIVFDGDYSIVLNALDLPFVQNALIVDGAGKTVSISGNHIERIFRLSDADSDLTVANLTLKDGGADNGGAGGAILVENGVLRLQNVAVSGCKAGIGGGAIYSSGDVFLDAVTFTQNSAQGDGGAIYMGAATSLSIQGATFTANVAKNRGGAIYLAGVDSSADHARPVELDHCVFTLNKAEGSGAERGGGAIWATGDDGPEDVFRISASQFLSNSAPNGGGGAILLTFGSRLAYADSLQPQDGGIHGCHFQGNTSGGEGFDGMGGAIFNRGTLTVVASSFLDNEAGASSGGAIAHRVGSAASLTVANATFSGNF
jgi:predicted outer membrane repeat protein